MQDASKQDASKQDASLVQFRVQCNFGRCGGTFGLWSVLTVAEIATQSSEFSAMYCVQSTTVQHALFSVQYSVHCAALCVALRDEAISAASGLNAPIHFDPDAVFTSIPFSSLPQTEISLQVCKNFTSISRGAVWLAKWPVRVRLWGGSQRERDWSWEKHSSVSDTASTTG